MASKDIMDLYYDFSLQKFLELSKKFIDCKDSESMELILPIACSYLKEGDSNYGYNPTNKKILEDFVNEIEDYPLRVQFFLEFVTISSELSNYLAHGIGFIFGELIEDNEIKYASVEKQLTFLFETKNFSLHFSKINLLRMEDETFKNLDVYIKLFDFEHSHLPENPERVFYTFLNDCNAHTIGNSKVIDNNVEELIKKSTDMGITYVIFLNLKEYSTNIKR